MPCGINACEDACMNDPSGERVPPRPIGIGVGMLAGVAAVALLGGLGAVLWLRWLWSRTPPLVRNSTVPAGHRKAVLWIVAGSFAAGILGFVATIVSMVYTRLARCRMLIRRKRPGCSRRVRTSWAMTFTTVGLVIQFAGCVFALVAGYRLLLKRETAHLASRAHKSRRSPVCGLSISAPTNPVRQFPLKMYEHRAETGPKVRRFKTKN